MHGALLTMGIMSGAIFFHVASPLGIDPYNPILWRGRRRAVQGGLLELAVRGGAARHLSAGAWRAGGWADGPADAPRHLTADPA